MAKKKRNKKKLYEQYGFTTEQEFYARYPEMDPNKKKKPSSSIAAKRLKTDKKRGMN